jgi:hypothetical protein
VILPGTRGSQVGGDLRRNPAFGVRGGVDNFDVPLCTQDLVHARSVTLNGRLHYKRRLSFGRERIDLVRQFEELIGCRSNSSTFGQVYNFRVCWPERRIQMQPLCVSFAIGKD